MALETSTWLNLCFVEKILRKSEGDNSIQVIDIFSKPATNKGDNYTSDMVRVIIEFSREQAGRKITEKKSIVIKVAPIAEGMRKILVMRSGIFDKEILMLTDVLVKMNKLLGPKHRLSAKSLYVQKENPTLLVLEDLAPLNFHMANREAGLDLDHCILALRGLARFHASSLAVCEKEQHLLPNLKRGMFREDYPKEMGGFFIMSTKTLADEVANWPELGKRYSEKIAKIADDIYKIGIKASEFSEDEFSVVNHGDFWVNNMLFKYNDDGKPTDHICVDFQMSVYTSPAIDLLYFLSTSPSVEVCETKKSFMLNEYHNTLMTTMKQVGCKTPPPTMEELKNSMKRRAAYGMIASFTVLPIVLCDKNKLKDIDEMMKEDGSYESLAHKGELYRKIMTRRIPVYDELGLLDN